MPAEPDWMLELSALLGPSLTLLNDGVDQARPFFERPSIESDAEQQLAVDGAQQALNHLCDALQTKPWDGKDKDRAQALLGEAAKAAGVKKVIMKPLRAALLRMQGPICSPRGRC